MGVTKKIVIKKNNGTDWDIIYPKTTADQVITSTTQQFVSQTEKDTWNAKPSKSYVDTELGKKSDKTYVDTELGKKSDKTYVDNTFIPLAQKGSNNGVATLNSSGVIPSDQIPSSYKESVVVADIAERDALVDKYEGLRVIVTDATADPTVAVGWAEYVWGPAPGEWIKMGEGESLDLILEWSNIQGRPSSSVANIDDAVVKKHSHSNKAVLDATSASFTTALKSAYDSAVTDKHTHGNKSVLDATTASFTTALKNDISSNKGKAHTHTNSAILNAMTAAFTTTLKTTYDANAYIEVSPNEPVRKDLWFEEV